MKKYSFILTLILPLFFLSSCGLFDSGDDAPVLNMRLATLEPGVDTKFQFIVGGITYVPLNSNTFGNYKPLREEGQRVYIGYYLVDNADANKKMQRIDLVSIQNVLTKDVVVLNEDNKNDIGDQRVTIKGLYLEDGYLNVQVSFYMSTVSSEAPTIDLVNNQVNPQEGVTTNLVPLDLRVTNPGKDAQLVTALASFYLGAYDPNNIPDKEGISLRVKTSKDSHEIIELTFIAN